MNTPINNNTWWDEKRLSNLESISRKFASSEALVFTREEIMLLKQLKERNCSLSPAIIQFFMNSVTPEMFLTK